jgi:ribonuclease HI
MKQLHLFERSDRAEKETSSVHRSYWKLFVDGASRNNPGPSGAGIYIIKNDHVVEQLGYYLGIKTNNQAEYLALIIGLLFLNKNRVSGDYVMICSDSQLLVRQIEGAYKVKNPLLKPLHALAKKLLADIKYTIAHVMREDNSNADELANNGIDKKVFLNAGEIDFLQQHEISIY